MFNTLILLLLLHYLGFFIKKGNTNVLSCGIFGWSGGDVKTFDKDKFNILGLANQSRGEDSCGVGANGNIYVGHGKDKKYGAWLQGNYHNDKIFKLGNIKSIIGHTRNASVGTVTLENAHPFGFGFNKKAFTFLGVHNGTIYNKEEIADKFNLEKKRKNNDTEVSKIDSELLFEAIYRNKDFKVLSFYRGAAAIAFVNTKTPSRLYLFRGESKKYSGQPEEERPLFVYKENENSLYFSSLEDPLFYIGGTEENVEEIEANTVYEIKNGNIEKAETFKIDRSESTQSNIAYKNYGNHDYGRRSEFKTKPLKTPYDDFQEDYYGRSELGFSYPAGNRHSLNGVLEEEIPDAEVLEEDTKEKVNGYIQPQHDVLEFKTNCRFYNSANQLAGGIYALFPGKGFIYLAKNYLEAVGKMSRMAGKWYVSGEFVATVTAMEINAACRPFDKLRPGEDIEKYLYYFAQGTMLKSKFDYNQLMITSKNAPLSPLQLSHVSVYPVRHTQERGYQHALNLIYHEGNPYSGKIKVAGGIRTLYCTNGVLKKHRATKILIPEYGATHYPDNWYLPNGENKKLNSAEKKEDRVITNEEASSIIKRHNKMGQNKAEEALASCVAMFDLMLDELESHKDTPAVKETIKTFTECEDLMYKAMDSFEENK